MTLPTQASCAWKVLVVEPFSAAAAAEIVFSLLKSSFTDGQGQALQDYIETSLMLQYNKHKYHFTVGRMCVTPMLVAVLFFHVAGSKQTKNLGKIGNNRVKKMNNLGIIGKKIMRMVEKNNWGKDWKSAQAYLRR